ncbi:hypothetical protein [Caulobacter hibisci]|uniref:Uncharacterized protein n=1 Tax=Caulobacter hibisci TaxID=2035993 RepID=A0ABS0T1W4_9CAUL|nr:hypothetical protein [Caulobacter hibisci]MBI1684862.1 hypothetical protein [Caulobacter hibisci]
MDGINPLGMRLWIGLAIAGALPAGAGAQPQAAQPASIAPGSQYTYCWATRKPQPGQIDNSYYYSPIFVGRPGDEADKAAFAAAVVGAYGGEAGVSSCSSRATAAEMIAVRDRRFNRDAPHAVMTSLLPGGARVANIEGASVPRTDPPGDGSLERPLILECTAAAGQFSSLTQRYETAQSVLVKIAGGQVSIWKRSASSWIQHPCVENSRNGQFCAITPTRIWLKDSYELTRGAEESNELDIDRRSAGFKFETLLATPKVAPYIQARQATGACRPTKEPAPAATPPAPRTAF